MPFTRRNLLALGLAGAVSVAPVMMLSGGAKRALLASGIRARVPYIQVADSVLEAFLDGFATTEYWSDNRLGIMLALDWFPPIWRSVFENQAASADRFWEQVVGSFLLSTNFFQHGSGDLEFIEFYEVTAGCRNPFANLA
jgi:hypothetical protein